MGFSPRSSLSLPLSFVLLFLASRGSLGSTFTFVNRCGSSVWPGILANAGSPALATTGFELPKDTTRSLQAPTGWSGRFWARTGCDFDRSGSGSCATGDCGSGQVECNGLGAAPPVTLAEFTLGSGGNDFYDVSLVDGYNLPMVVEVSGGSGECAATGCTTDINRQCPAELRVGDGNACKSACEAFRSPEYCCNGAYATPATCRPSVYSEMFKAACPRSYSYAYDDATSTFTCSGGDYTVTFCPSSPSQKSASYSAPVTGSSAASQGSDPVPGSEMGYSGQGFGYGYQGTGSESGQTMLQEQDGSWLAGLAMGGSPRATGSPPVATLLSAFTVMPLLYGFIYL
ncbi:PREDICTED: thaumatin-like protein 1b [Tarenaya hassleriana]|uniref:thaumatin-like protein 1b n=1 Tax=Tarenaya hassleriana TaxID=28532 RepID=UPI00053C5206|nr:PREDICTED: thaumatin-like protein 1b [Tarenaya hassleriana]